MEWWRQDEDPALGDPNDGVLLAEIRKKACLVGGSWEQKGVQMMLEVEWMLRFF